MSEENAKPWEAKKIRDREEARTSHWLFSRRGPKFLDPLFRLFENPILRVGTDLHEGQVAADLGCGWGHYSFALADIVGPAGKVYAIDLGKSCIRSIRESAAKRGYHNIEACAASASELSFIPDRSVDFVFANGLLCSMAYGRQLAVDEIRRILKRPGKAYLSLGMAPPFGYVNQAEWEIILGGFTVERGGSYKEMWAVVFLNP